METNATAQNETNIAIEGNVLPAVADNRMQMYIAIEQGEHAHQSQHYIPSGASVGYVANLLLNEVFSMMSIAKMTQTSKNRPSLNQPFTFALGFEAGYNDPARTLAVPEFKTKISMTDKGAEKLLQNMPQVIAELLTDKTMPFAERRALLKNASIITIDL